MSEEDRLKGSFLFDVLVAGSLGGGGLSGAPLGGGCRAGMTFPFTGLKFNVAAVSQCLIDSSSALSFLTHTHTHTRTQLSANVTPFTETCRVCYFSANDCCIKHYIIRRNAMMFQLPLILH